MLAYIGGNQLKQQRILVGLILIACNGVHYVVCMLHIVLCVYVSTGSYLDSPKNVFNFLFHLLEQAKDKSKFLFVCLEI